MANKVAKKKGRDVVVKYVTVLQWLPKYNKFRAVSDIIAGITIGLTMIPQSIAYAALANLSSEYGLYSSFLGGFVYLIFGTVREVSIGPSSLMALLTLNYTRDMPVDFVVLLTFLAGCVELLMGLLNLGFLVDFISVPVTSGFTSATSVIIIIAQLQGLVGLKYKSKNILDNVRKLFENLGDVRFNDASLGFASIVFLLCFRVEFSQKFQYLKLSFVKDEGRQKLLKKILWVMSISRNALIVLICFIISYRMDDGINNPFILSSQVESGFPRVAIPPFSSNVENTTYKFVDMCSHLGFGIFVVPLVAVLANVAIAKAFATTSGVNASQEMRTLGLCNILGSLVSSMPTCGAFTRSAVSSASGIQTPMAGLYTGIMALLALSYLTPYFYFIPRATLSAVLICAVMFLIDVKIVPVLWKGNKIDAMSLILTFAMCLLFSVEIGLLVGIALNTAYLLYLSARPKIEVSQCKTNEGDEYMIATPDVGHFYPAVDFINEKVYKLTEKRTNDNIIPIVIDCSKFKGVDYTAVKGIERLATKFEESKRRLLLANVSPDIAEQIERLSSSKLLHIVDNMDNIHEHLDSKYDSQEYAKQTAPLLSELQHTSESSMNEKSGENLAAKTRKVMPVVMNDCDNHGENVSLSKGED